MEQKEPLEPVKRGLPLVCVESANTCGTSCSDGSLVPTEPVEPLLSWTELKGTVSRWIWILMTCRVSFRPK